MQSKNLLEKLIIYIYAHLYNLILEVLPNESGTIMTCITYKQNSFWLTFCPELFCKSRNNFHSNCKKKKIGFDYQKRIFFFTFFLNLKFKNNREVKSNKQRPMGPIDHQSILHSPVMGP